MTRARLLFGLAALALVGGTAVLVGRWPSSPAQTVPTVAVVRTTFTRAVVAEGFLEPIEATSISVPSDSGSTFKVAWMVSDGAEVAAGDLVVRFDATEATQQHEGAQAALASADNREEQARIERVLAESGRDRVETLAGAELETARAFQSRDSEIWSRRQLIESEIDSLLAEAKLANAEETRRIEQRLSGARAELVAFDGQRARMEIEQANKILERLEVRAPHAGVLVLTKNRRGERAHIGDTLWPGQKIGEIPRRDALAAEMFVLEADAAGLVAGLSAAVRVDAHPDLVVAATVDKVATLARPRLQGATVQYFATTLTLERTEPARMKPGQSVRATVQLGGAEALVLPRQAVFEREGRPIAWRWADGVFVPAPLELGVSSPGRVTITSGLTEGDRVALTDPGQAPEPGAAGGAP